MPREAMIPAQRVIDALAGATSWREWDETMAKWAKRPLNPIVGDMLTVVSSRPISKETLAEVAAELRWLRSERWDDGAGCRERCEALERHLEKP